MKNLISTLFLMFLSLFLMAGTSIATTYTFDDNQNFFPGYEFNASRDELGNRPHIDSMTVDVEGDYLTSVSINFDLSGGVGDRIQFDSLFINSDGTDYEWDYYIVDGTDHTNIGQNIPAPGAYSVADGYQASIVSSGGRNGHINGIQDIGNDLTAMSGFYTIDDTDDSILTYDLAGLGILVGSNWRIGYTPYCANDVISGSPVPEPATMLLLGMGLIGIAGIVRRKK